MMALLLTWSAVISSFSKRQMEDWETARPSVDWRASPTWACVRPSDRRTV